ncbi:hypothetical protein Tco_0471996 [Tanacetum coccineum]
MCMFALTVSIVRTHRAKNFMQFDRLQVWELVDKPFGKNGHMYLTSSRTRHSAEVRTLVSEGFLALITAFSDADHVSCVDTRKSTSGEIQFIGDKLVSWMSKKQDYTAMSSAEVEYVVLSASSIAISCNPVAALPGIITYIPVSFHHGKGWKTANWYSAVDSGRMEGVEDMKTERITMLIADIEDDIMDPVMQCTTLPSHSVHKLLTRVLRIILVIVPEHLSDTYVLTMKMEILLEPASNKLLVDVPVMRTSKHGKSNTCVLEILKASTDTPYLLNGYGVLGITSIMVNGKNAYELKGNFLDDLHKNAFNGTHGEDAVEHIKYFLKIVDPIDLPNVNQDKLGVVVFPISLAGDAWRWFDGIKGSITKVAEIFRIETNLFDYETPLCEKFNEFNYLLKIDPDLLTKDIEGFKTYEEYKDDWIYEWNENVPWVHENSWTDTGKEDGYCNGGNLPGAYIVGNTLHYQDLEWYDALKDSELKDEALRNKAIMEGLIDKDDESSNNSWRRWDVYEIAYHDQEESEYENSNEDRERCELFNDHRLPVCIIRRFEMIKYSFGDDEEYVSVKEDEYDDLTNISKDACGAYQEIFHMMDEGWIVTKNE